MSPSATRAPSHSLLVAATERRRRAGAAGWVDDELADGAKVLYKGWPADGVTPWIAGDDGARAGAFASGQLEFLDFPTLIERSGGSLEGIRAHLTDEVERALDEGWSRIAMSQESPQRPMAGVEDVAETAAQEHVFDRLVERWPVRVLCQLTLESETDAAVRETVALHHREILDDTWSASTADGWWQPRGELDVTVARQFRSAVSGALREGRHARGPLELHLDLSEVGFMDVACVEALLDAARTAPAARRLVVHRPSSVVTRLVAEIGAPESVELEQAR